jgi:CheY-like chemotaxis protein
MNGLAVLCIDNEPRILEGMRSLLESWGCRVMTAASADVWLPGARHDMPDTIIADYHLDHATGIDAIRDIRAACGREVPALLITADRSIEVRAAAERDGIALQNKPVRPAALRAWLTRSAAMPKAAAE